MPGRILTRSGYFQPVIAGRDHEREMLRELLAKAVDGTGVSVLISGEAGIGKTTLVRWLTGEAERQGMLTLTGYCFDQSATQPYGPWNELFASYAPTGNLPAAIPVLLQNADMSATVSQASLFERTRAFIAALAARQPVLLVLEDLHWSDQASLALLRYLARQIRDLPVLLALTYRDDEITRGHELFAVIPHLIREAGTERLELQRLDAVAMDELLAQFDLLPADQQRLAEYLLERAGGNPLFTQESLRSLILDGVLQHTKNGIALGELKSVQVPPLVNQLIEQRLDRLDEENRQALEIAAVIGNDVPLGLWQTLLATEPQSIPGIVEQVTTAHVLEESNDRHGLQFVHALVRDTLYENIPLIRRQELHRRVADALIQHPDADPDTVASHLQQAGDDRALEWLVRAGLRAQRSATWMTASDRYLQVAAMLEGDDSRAIQRGWLIYEAGTLLRHADPRRSWQLIEQASAIAAKSGNEVFSAHCLFHRGVSHLHRDEIAIGLDLLRRGAAELDRLAEEQYLPCDDAQAEIIIRSLVPRLELPQLDGVELPASPGKHSSPVVIQRGVVVNWLALSGQYAEALAIGDIWQQRMQADFAGYYLRQITGVSGHLGLGTSHAMSGFPGEARRNFQTARTAAEPFGDYWVAHNATKLELTLIQIPFYSDDIRGRTRLLEEADRLWTRVIDLSVITLERTPCRTFVDLLEGQWDEVSSMLEDREQWQQLQDSAIDFCNLARLARYRGDRGLAFDLIHQVLPHDPTSRPGNYIFAPAMVALRLAAALSLDTGELDLAAAWLDAHERWLSWSGACLGQAEHHLLMARFHHLAGDSEAAQKSAGRASQVAAKPRQPLAIIAVERMLGELAAGQRRFIDAGEHFTRSVEIADRCAAPFERARTLLPWADLCLQSGDLPAARHLLSEVRSICEPLNAALVLDKAKALERKLRRATGRHPSGLTKREVEVMRLAADGLTNAEIGESLFISPRTAGQHLSAIYNKFGVNSRAAAVTRWSEFNAE